MYMYCVLDLFVCSSTVYYMYMYEHKHTTMSLLLLSRERLVLLVCTYVHSTMYDVSPTRVPFFSRRVGVGSLLRVHSTMYYSYE